MAEYESEIPEEVYMHNIMMRETRIKELDATVADLERQLAAARKRIGWWERLWEIARNADPGLHEMLRDRFEQEGE